MKSTIKRFPKDVTSWWDKVGDDVRWAEHNLAGGFYSETCFVTQQIVEKALKTFLLDQDTIIPKIHKLPILLKRCVEKDSSFSVFLNSAKSLDQYYIATRYPPSFGPEGGYTRKEAEDALGLAKEIVKFVGKKLKR